MLVSCSRCGRIHKRGECPVKRTYKKDDSDRLRNKYAWRKKREQIKEDALGLCEVCKALGVYTYDNLEVHHITKLKDNSNGLLEDDNLITLCVYHHKQADSGEIDADYLRELAKQRGK